MPNNLSRLVMNKVIEYATNTKYHHELASINLVMIDARWLLLAEMWIGLNVDGVVNKHS